MNGAGQAAWEAANQRYLTAEVEALRRVLEARAATPEDEVVAPPPPASAPGPFPAELPPPNLERLTELFGLSAFERSVVLLAAGMELDAAWPALCAGAQGDPQRPYPTFSLALAALAEPHWDALSPAAPLRYWQLIEIDSSAGLTAGELRLDERVLHYLTGFQTRDEQLAGLAEPLPPTDELVPSHRELARRLASSWSEAVEGPNLPVIQLCGDEAGDKRAVAVAVCAELGLLPFRMPADALPTDAAGLEGLSRRWQREAILSGGVLLLDCDVLEAADPVRDGAIGRLVEGVTSPLIVTSVHRRRLQPRSALTFEVEKPTAEEQRQLWRATLGERAEGLNGQVERLVGQFHLNAPMIRAACGNALGSLALEDGEGALDEVLWNTCRVQARPGLEDLAQRIDSAVGWDDLVLPKAQQRLLREIIGQLRSRPRVHDAWGFETRGARGLGIAALFAGVSGTGKTLAAEVVAAQAGLDLHRIDLSTVVSKYIGETEKNLRRVFHAAEAGGAILLFDEADALFGKRTQVQDSHDRYANIEVSYLLQRMESYRGLAILTTNLKDSLDPAFLRRFRFIVDFPFPGPELRAEIWRRVFPAKTPTEGLDPQRLARLKVTGGSIRNIALNAAFLAAEAESAVTMAHLLQAARRELAKLDEAVPEAAVSDWV